MMEIRTKHLAIAVPAVFVAGIALTMAFNLWQTTTSKEPAKYTSGEFAGQANPADIRGSYTFADVARAFPGVPLEVLAEAFGVTGNAAAFAVKSLEALAEASGAYEGSAYEIGTDSIRLFVARYLGLAFEPEPTTGLPARAVELLAATGRLDAAALSDIESRVVGAEATATAPAATAAAAPVAPAASTKATAADTAAAPAVQPSASTAAAAPTETATSADAAASHTPANEAVTADRTVKGSTTFKQLADWGVSGEALAEVLGAEPGAAGTTLRDWCSARGIEFSTVKSKVQALVDGTGP